MISPSRKRAAPVDWVVWPSGARSVAWKCGHTYTCADEGEEVLACPQCAGGACVTKDSVTEVAA